MASDKHENLIWHTGSSDEAYAAFQRHFRRDNRILQVLLVLYGFAAYGGIKIAGHTDWFWLFLGGLALLFSVFYFVDNSNRNWAMHVIDFAEQRKERDAT